MLKSIFSIILIACISVAVSVPTADAGNNNSSNDRDYLIGLPEVISLTFMTGAFIISPYGKMQREIYTLKQDQLFLRRHLLINQDPTFRKQTFSVLEITRAKQRETEHKLRRFSYWFFPSLVVAGTGIFYLSDWALD
ncbi:hypothetical protein J4G08_00275 [Candidatus Poribacteria bacterium]|nr:hypothetical protein [Candidatus Poribacteria bacterium]